LQRQLIKEMLQGWEKEYPGRLETIFSAIKNVAPSQLADTNLFDFIGLKLQRGADADDFNPDKIDIVNLTAG
jgi:tRNA 2-thiocytidine biosynthesis protein TtcA